MENPKVYAYLYSNEIAGTEMKRQEVEIIGSKKTIRYERKAILKCEAPAQTGAGKLNALI